MSQQSFRAEGSMAAAPKLEPSDHDRSVDLRALPQGPQLAPPQQPTGPSVLSRLSRACQVRGFNPEWVPSCVHGRYRCAVKLGASLLARDKTHETPEQAKTAIAHEALAVVVNMPRLGRPILYRATVPASSHPSGGHAGNAAGFPPHLSERDFLIAKISQLLCESSYTVRMYESAASSVRAAFFDGVATGVRLAPLLAREQARSSARREAHRSRHQEQYPATSPGAAATGSHYNLPPRVSSASAPRGVVPASNQYPHRYDQGAWYPPRPSPSQAAAPPPSSSFGYGTTGQSWSGTTARAYASRSHTPRDYRDKYRDNDNDNNDDDERRAYHRRVERHRTRDGRSRSPMRGYN